MKKLYFLALLSTLLAFITPSGSLHAQSRKRTKLSANCGKCGRAVAATSRVGQRCPHCGVVWGRENTTTTTSPSYYNSDFGTTKMPDLSEYTSSGSLGGMSGMGGSPFENETNTIRTCTLRAAPSTKAVGLGSISKNSSVTILKRSGEWVKVSYFGTLGGDGYNINTYRGWIHSSNLVY
jgi:predicted RNA-binding Zn-ribbon protein involved in translation (DUF1610 family)